ncbi:MAG: glycosyltransferase, partial [Candidatus Omnitrophica bacterium]|nr:glycosyltransferase [Candidatus Omnitrophota bacterium]
KFLRCIPDELKSHPDVTFFLGKTLGYKKYAPYLKKSGFDFAIAPLEDNPFNRCKSNIKFLEYSVCKIPAIYSRVGPYIDSVEDGETGILCRNDTKSWIEAMERLIEDQDLRNKLRDAAFEKVIYNYMIDNRLEVWHNFFEMARNKAKGHHGKRLSGSYLQMSAPCFIRSELSKLYWDAKRFLKI